MKLIKIVIICILFLFQAAGLMAQRIELNPLTSIQLADSAKKLSLEQALAWSNDNYIEDKDGILTLFDVRLAKNGVFYQFQNILILLHPNEQIIHVKPSYLTDLKKGYDAMSRDSSSYSQIIKIKGNKVFLSHMVISNLEVYHFVIYNRKITRALGGSVYFHHEDALQAKLELDRFLGNVKLNVN